MLPSCSNSPVQPPPGGLRLAGGTDPMNPGPGGFMNLKNLLGGSLHAIWCVGVGVGVLTATSYALGVWVQGLAKKWVGDPNLFFVESSAVAPSIGP